MSAEIKVFIDKQRMLNFEEWIKAINEHGFELQFDHRFVPHEHQGFLPCTYKGNTRAGFEYYYDPIEDTMFSLEANPEIQGKDLCVSFCSSFEQDDIASAMIAASILAKLCDGSYWVMTEFVNDDPIEMAKQVVEHGIGI